MKKVIGIRTTKKNHYAPKLGGRLETNGFQINYILSDEEKKDGDVFVLIIDEQFSVIEACSYLLSHEGAGKKLVWVLSANNESEKERNMLYQLGISHYMEQSTECNEEFYSIVNTMNVANVQKKEPILDSRKRVLVIDDKESVFTPKEYKLLSELYAKANEVVLYSDITQLLWGEDYTEKWVVRIANIVHSIRQKLASDSTIKVQTIRKNGYMLVQKKD